MNTTGGENTFIGALSGQMNTTGGHNVYIAAATWENSSFNTYVGDTTAHSVVSGGNNTALGCGAIYAGGMSQSVGVGSQALAGNSTAYTFSGPIAVGDTIAVTMTSPGNATLGTQAFVHTYSIIAQAGSLTAGALATAMTATILADSVDYGHKLITANAQAVGPTCWLYFPGSGTSGAAVTSVGTVTSTGTPGTILTIGQGLVGDKNVAIGYQSMLGRAATAGNENIAIGWSSLLNFTTAQGVIAIGGNQTGINVQGSANCIFMGSFAGNSIINSTDQIAFGISALSASATDLSAGNVAIGSFASQNYSGASNPNTAIGYFALRGAASVSTGGGNTAVGFTAGQNTTSGTYNTMLGHAAGNANTTGASNVFLGTNAGQRSTSGGNNVFAGRNTGSANTTGSTNTALGYQAGNQLTTGGDNVIIGANVAITTLQTGNSNILIGVDANTDTVANNSSNVLMIRGFGPTATPAIYATAIASALPKVAIGAGGGSAAPVAGTDILAGMSMVWKNSTDSTAKLYYNDAGTLKSVALT